MVEIFVGAQKDPGLGALWQHTLKYNIWLQLDASKPPFKVLGESVQKIIESTNEQKVNFCKLLLVGKQYYRQLKGAKCSGIAHECQCEQCFVDQLYSLIGRTANLKGALMTGYTQIRLYNTFLHRYALNMPSEPTPEQIEKLENLLQNWVGVCEVVDDGFMNRNKLKQINTAGFWVGCEDNKFLRYNEIWRHVEKQNVLKNELKKLSKGPLPLTGQEDKTKHMEEEKVEVREEIPAEVNIVPVCEKKTKKVEIQISPRWFTPPVEFDQDAQEFVQPYSEVNPAPFSLPPLQEQNETNSDFVGVFKDEDEEYHMVVDGTHEKLEGSVDCLGAETVFQAMNNE